MNTLAHHQLPILPASPGGGTPRLRVVSAEDEDDRSVRLAGRREAGTAAERGVGEPDAGGLEGALAADPPLAPTAELLAELGRLNGEFESAAPRDILAWAVARYGERFSMATAFGPEGMVLLHWLAGIDAGVHVFNLETGYQFDETLALRERVRERYGVEVELRRPELSVEEYESLHGGPVYRSNPHQCCRDRKLRVLQAAVRGRHAWATAIRRDQSPDRAAAPIVGWDTRFQLIKVNPLANMKKEQVWKLIVDEDIPYNPLHDAGYTSIGCQPCTRAVMFGEDERAGRWSGFAKTECGLHVRDGDGPAPASST